MEKKIKQLLFTDYGRMILIAISFIAGAALGTDGVAEIEYMAEFWDYLYYISIAGIIGYTIYGIYRLIKNAFKK